MATPVRATQNFVAHMGFCRRHPALAGLEIAWRWLFGIPLLLVIWQQVQRIAAETPPDSVGLDKLVLTNPWLSSHLLANAAEVYAPAATSVLGGLVPAGLVVWSVISGLGRTVILARMARQTDGGGAGFLRRVPAVIALQLIWAVAFVGVMRLWLHTLAWDAHEHLISATGAAEPDLEGFLIWLILISLALYVLWAAVSWVLTVAPIVLLWERRSLLGALGRSFRLGREFSSKLAEINLVMQIVRIALLVLALVFSSAPLPFSDQLGADSLHQLYQGIVVMWLIASDYFHVVRLKSFVELWRMYGSAGAEAAKP